MVQALSIAVTNLTSKFGIILSRKAAVRLATNTGKALADKTKSLGRLANKEEIESVFAQTLPRRCTPQIITTDNEVINILKKTGIPEQEITQILQSDFIAAVIDNGSKKQPIFMPFGKKNAFCYDIATESTALAHEVEHALENNNMISGIIRRKLSVILTYINNLFNKNHIKDLIKIEISGHKVEDTIHNEISWCIDKTGEFIPKETNITKIDEYLTQKRKLGIVRSIKESLHSKYVNPNNKGSFQLKKFSCLRYILTKEIPAYTVTSEVYKYTNPNSSYGLIYEALTNAYKATLDITKKDKRLYLKNKLHGRLEKPNIFEKDKDLLRYAASKQEKQALKEIMSKLNDEQKKSLIKVLHSHTEQQNTIIALKTFLDKTTVKDKNVYLELLEIFEKADCKLLTNPDFIKIAKIANNKKIYPSNLEMVADMAEMIYSIVRLNPDKKVLRIYAGKLQKAIRNKQNIKEVVEEYYKNTASFT
ncbi:MAG: hypothetical protein MJ237_05470 [bacterium]|nr:hypothetical protein [bacterium]